jgi:hypothetical protein
MTKVEHISQFPKGSYVAQFFGKNYDDAIKNAGNFGEYYYCQIHCGKSKSILVSYNKENENEIS